MSRYALGLFSLGVIIWLAGCGWSLGYDTKDSNQSVSQWGAGLLPGLPQNPVARAAAEAGSRVFTRTDQLTREWANWEGDVLSLDQDNFAYSIVYYNLGTNEPVSIDLAGTLNGLWLAVSDYNTGGWHFLGGAHNSPQTHDLTDGNYKSPTDWIYFALVCPIGASADVTSTLEYVPFTPTELDPPEWEGEVGIKSLDTKYFDVAIEWYPAVDAESPPVTYLIYYAENSAGINWDNPQLTVPAGFTSTTFGIDENTVFRDYAVRAQDAQGNITANTNFLSGSIPWEYTLPIFDWVPGDKMVMTWDDPAMDSYFWLIGPHWLEGTQEDPWELEGLVEFSELSGNSGVEEVWAKLLGTAPQGGYLVEAYMGAWGTSTCTTYTFSILDSEGAFKTHLVNYTIDPGTIMGGDMFYLRNGPLTWPQDEVWQTGDRLEITWDDPAVNVDLWVETPIAQHGSPEYPDELIGKIDFSQSSEDSGEAVEWAQLAEGGDLGSYLLSIQWMDEGGPDPGNFDVTWTLYDSEGGVRLGPGTAEISSDWGDVWRMFWLDMESGE